MDKCYYKDFIEDEKQFYLHEAGFDSREEQLLEITMVYPRTFQNFRIMWTTEALRYVLILEITTNT